MGGRTGGWLDGWLAGVIGTRRTRYRKPADGQMDGRMAAQATVSPRPVGGADPARDAALSLSVVLAALSTNLIAIEYDSDAALHVRSCPFVSGFVSHGLGYILMHGRASSSCSCPPPLWISDNSRHIPAMLRFVVLCIMLYLFGSTHGQGGRASTCWWSPPPLAREIISFDMSMISDQCYAQ